MDKDTLLEAYTLMCTARAMAEIYDANRPITKYVHSTSRGHEAIQLAVGMQLQGQDYASPYYRDESMLLGMGMSPYELMLQLLAKAEDPFSGGRTYYSHPNLKRDGFPRMPHQSSATGMQAIPATGMAHGIAYLESQGLIPKDESPVVVCSFGDGSITEGEVAEAFQMAVLKKLPIFYLVQDNDWGISASGAEMRAMDAYEYAGGFKGMERMRVDGSDFNKSWTAVVQCMDYVREKRQPILLHAKVPLLGHHTSGVRKEWYRTEDDLKKHGQLDPLDKMYVHLVSLGIDEAELQEISQLETDKVSQQFKLAVESPDPSPSTVMDHIYADRKSVV